MFVKKTKGIENVTIVTTKEQLKTINSCLLTTKRSLKYILSNRDNELDIKDIIKSNVLTKHCSYCTKYSYRGKPHNNTC